MLHFIQWDAISSVHLNHWGSNCSMREFVGFPSGSATNCHDMARDGLLPAFFSEISPRTQVPVKSTIAIGVLAAALTFFMDVAQLSEMVKCWHSNGIHCRCSLCASS
ncbi:hypothetical protein ISN44_As08g003400 [Arabidopsis suecica]|uniref:Uncharacterized protein n=1 Tax=Arabidopsis suecica TaxID=45249 RepID=A0A8T2B1S1_ARASU|nr:hypothetical protein ISN44_As08g003400 [Arabidopsis suecica]